MRLSARLANAHLGLPSLASIGICSGAIYLLALLRFPLLEHYAQPHQNLGTLTHSAASIGLVIAGCVVLLFAGYALGARTVGALGEQAATLPLVAGFGLAFSVLLLLVQPVTSTDLYDYLFRGRMLVRYAANPFVQVPQNFARDPLFGFIAWPRAVSAYGPLWEGMSWLAARLAGEAPGAPSTNASAELLRLLLAYKLLSAIGFLLCGAAIWSAFGRIAPERRCLGLYLWLWNPLALWESVTAGHNDAWMALTIVVALGAIGCSGWAGARAGQLAQRAGAAPGRAAIGVWRQRLRDALERQSLGIISTAVFANASAALRARYDAAWPARPAALRTPNASVTLPIWQYIPALAALGALVIGALVKYIALFLCPLVLAAGLRRLPSWRERRRLALAGGLICVVLVALAYAPFWEGWGTLRNVGDRRAIFTISWLAGLQALLSGIGVGQESAQTIAASIGLALLAIGTAWATWQAWRRPRDLAQHALWLMLWFIFVCNPSPQPWYMLWVLAIAALQPWRKRLVGLVVLGCCAAALVYIAIAFLAPAAVG